MRFVHIFSRLAIAAVVGLAGMYSIRADEPTPVVIDSWWNEDYAKEFCSRALAWYEEERALIARHGCEAVTACTDMMPRVQSCQLQGPVSEIRDFEDRLVTYMTANAQCKGVRLVRYSGPDADNKSASNVMKGNYWMLTLDYIPGDAKQAWALNGGTFTALQKAKVIQKRLLKACAR